jgi:tRNA G18 (ribose-2'-O)-methylase SpoU
MCGRSSPKPEPVTLVSTRHGAAATLACMSPIDRDSSGAGRRLLPAELTARQPDSRQLPRLPRLPVVAVLENVRSLWNVGSMFRTADAARLDRLFLCGFTGHPPRPEIDKTALGACAVVPWEYWTSATEACAWLRERGYQLMALERTTHSVDLETAALQPPLGFVVGNEVTGVSDEVLDLCHGALEIPMAGRKESLNVAVAFGVAAFTLRRRLANAER